MFHLIPNYENTKKYHALTTANRITYVSSSTRYWTLVGQLVMDMVVCNMDVYWYRFKHMSTREIIDVFAPNEVIARRELKYLTPFYSSFVLV